MPTIRSTAGASASPPCRRRPTRSRAEVRRCSDNESRDQQQAALAAKEPALDLKIDGTKVNLDFQNLDTVQVNYYEMDLEFLFSTTPFVSSDGGGFSIVKPNRTEVVKLPAGKQVHTFPLPNEYQAKNVLVEVVGGGKRRSQAVYANELRTIRQRKLRHPHRAS